MEERDVVLKSGPDPLQLTKRSATNEREAPSAVRIVGLDMPMWDVAKLMVAVAAVNAVFAVIGLALFAIYKSLFSPN